MANGLKAVSRMHLALEALADAMVSGDPDRVLANERAIAAAAADLVWMAQTAEPPSSHGEALMLRTRVRQARAALDRCRQLGASTAELSALLFAAPTGYSSQGALPVDPAGASLFSSRT
jgi:hypothetical protein